MSPCSKAGKLASKRTALHGGAGPIHAVATWRQLASWLRMDFVS
jgi:hypothetical protein